MAYATTALVEADFKDMTFTTTTNVKIADVDQFIVESDALINSYVGSVYVVPVVTSGAGLELLKLLSRSLTAARIKRLMEVKQDKGTDANQNILSVLLSPDKVMDILKDIQKQNIVLAGADLLVSGGGFYNKNVADDIETVAKKDERQW